MFIHGGTTIEPATVEPRQLSPDSWAPTVEPRQLSPDSWAHRQLSSRRLSPRQLSLSTVEPTDRGAFLQWRLEDEGEGNDKREDEGQGYSKHEGEGDGKREDEGQGMVSVRLRTVVSMRMRVSISSKREVYLILSFFSEVFKYNIFSFSLSV